MTRPTGTPNAQKLSEKVAKMNDAVEEFMRIKKHFPDTTMSEVARDHGVNLNTMRARVRKASGLILTRPEEDRLRGYAIGLYDSGGACTKKALLEQAHIIQYDKEFPAKLVDRSWLRGFLDRYPEVQLRGVAKADNVGFVRSYTEFCGLWEDIAKTSLEYNILEPSQFWYLNETSFLADYDGDLVCFKRYEDAATDNLESGESPITVLMAYSAAGDLTEPTLLFEEGEKPQESPSSASGIKLSTTDDGLLDGRKALKWLKRFEASSKQYIKPERWRYLFMDGTVALTLEFVEYAVDHKIIIRPIRNYSCIHDSLSEPAEQHVFGEMGDVYHSDEDGNLVDASYGFLDPQQFYNTFQSKWQTTFADPDVCADAFESAGIFPVDMTKNEEVMAYKSEPEREETGQSAEVTLQSLGEHSAPISQQIRTLLDERLTKRSQDTDSSTEKTDYFLLHQTRGLLLEETAKVNQLSKEIALLKGETGAPKGNGSPERKNGNGKLNMTIPGEAFPRAVLGEKKRPAAQSQPWGNSKRPRVYVAASAFW